LRENQIAMTPLRLRITAAAETAVRSGHPWVFGDSVRELNRDGQAGELAVIYDREDRFLAIGLFDPDSPIRVRVLHRGKPEPITDAWWTARLEETLARRQDVFDELTTGGRLIHGESDGWPGLVLDRYDTTLVLKLYSGAWLPRLDEVADVIRARLQPDRLVLRLSRNVRVAAAGSGREEGVLSGAAPAGPVIFTESGLRFEADVLRGQKTGFFLDQRENRRRVETLARGRRVLNAFSFSGGFSLYAARGGAVSATDLDLSAHALAAAERNFALNASVASMARCRHESAQGDAFDWLGAQADRKFDLIVLDPPSFAPREAGRAAALRAYERLAGLGMARLERDGILVACSCSAHVSAREFFDAVRRAASRTKRKFNELAVTGHPPDHPVGFKEAEYLKGIYLGFA
jgi:23S rRNA (cytosine1962-C5)-methyltransferase